jgi:hypothetical protein
MTSLLCYIEFSSVKAWVEQLIHKHTIMKQLQTKGDCVPPAQLPTITPTLPFTEDQKKFEVRVTSGISSPAPACFTDEPEMVIEKAEKPSKYGKDLYRNPFPITQDLIDQIPSTSKKVESRFVTSLLRLLYTDEYLGTHTMATNLTGKKNMNEYELNSIISKCYL